MFKIVVLGSNSFAGASFINFCLKKKNIKIIGISRSPLSHAFKLINKNYNNKNFKFYKLDINKNLPKIIKIIRINNPNYIIDFLGQGMVAESWEKPDHWIQTNFLSKAIFLNKIKNLKYFKRYIRISTPEVYGSYNKKISETEKCNPSTPYAITHLSIDHLLLSLYKTFSFPSVILRFSNFYGPGQQLFRIIPKTIMCILSKKKIDLHGGGKSIRSFIFSEDFSKAIFLSLSKSKIGKVYNVTSNETISIINLIKLIARKMNYNFKDLIKITKDRNSKDFKYFMNSNLIKKEMGWKNKINLDKGIDKTITWHIKNFYKLKKQKKIYIHKK